MPETPNHSLLEQLPGIDEVLLEPAVANLGKVLPHDVMADAARTAVSEARTKLLDGEPCDVTTAAVAKRAAALASRLLTPSLKRAINASGVVIHTNLGRSVLSRAAREAVDSVTCGYSTLEYNIDTMSRGSRHDHCEALVGALTGAEAAVVVNNNAAAVLLVLSEFAEGHEAIVSRGEMVEIGGSFRIPDVMAQSHAVMVEVGTTNKTHDYDYDRAVSERTSVLLKAHTSNYRITGFCEQVTLRQLRQIADAHNAQRGAGDRVLVYEDQGSGAFIRLDAFGSYAEPAVVESLRQGADIVSFSGDKLLGGPQAGIIVGRADLIARLKANPLMRALRPDKMTLAALEATLRLYLDPEAALEQIPTLRMLADPAEEVERRAEHMMAIFAQRVSEDDAYLQVVPEVARAGGGALPMCDIESFAVEVGFIRGTAQGCNEFLVRDRPVPIIGRIHQDALLFDARTVLDESEMKTIAQSLAAYFKKLPAE